uniref:Uncharacterized protein n=1 Tax=viral metagenome TaxID=1070528 RepID=A0A6H1ZH40_9ZZZZ
MITPHEWINSRERFIIPRYPSEPKVDMIISKIVGKKIYQTDPRLLKLVAGWKKKAGKKDDDNSPDNFLEDSAKIKELKETLGGEI